MGEKVEEIRDVIRSREEFIAIVRKIASEDEEVILLLKQLEIMPLGYWGENGRKKAERIRRGILL
jgi:hypothetical protein